jgi:hypothetical protein
VQGVALSGERAGQRDIRVGGGTRNEPFVKGPLCAYFDGFSLHGAVRVAAGDRKRLEHLFRCAGRPATGDRRPATGDRRSPRVACRCCLMVVLLTR